ncbi:MAG TPA: hypothetical protein VEI50_09180 [Nitrospiraceae bacterium]|nr:hypothetical protein [Nitrospiraceae bacterium]
MAWQRVTLNQPLSEEDVSFVVNGKTSLSEVVEQLGAPNQMLSSNGGVVARYQFTDGKYFRVDFGWGLRFLSPFYSPDLVLGGGGSGADLFQITYNDHWIVQDHGFAFHSQLSEFRLWPFQD